MRVGPVGREWPVVSGDAGTWYDARPVCNDIDPDALTADGLARLRTALEAGELSAVDVSGLRIGPPISRPPTILCIGMNYAAHAAESGSTPPEDIVVFYKKTSAIAGPHDPIRAVDERSTLDWEVELGVVVGMELSGKVSESEAMSAIVGYVLANDLSDRWLQLDRSGGQWSKGKGFPGSGPLGPWIATADEIPDPQRLTLRSWVNEEPRQHSSTSDMIFPVATILRELAGVMTLEPGDIILTGTPEGVALSGRFPYLLPGDSVRMTIDGLGEIRQTVEPIKKEKE